MHSFDAGNGYSFHFNSDYSGDIIITHPNKEEYEIDADALWHLLDMLCLMNWSSI